MCPPRPANRSNRKPLATVAALLLAALALGSGPAAAQQSPAPAPPGAEQAYQQCMELARTQPDAAFAKAVQWRAHGGGFAAEHCEALALMGLRNFEDAAKRFHEVAEGAKQASVELRVEAYDQAAQAWLLANQPKKAKAEFDAALKLDPKNVDLLIGRGQASGLRGHIIDALDDLNAALDIDPKRADALVLRAASYRRVKAEDLALDDVNRAIQLDPEFPDAYVERGILMAVKGDYDAARRDWNKVAEMAPGTFLAQQAKRNLAELDRLSGKTPQAPAGKSAPPDKSKKSTKTPPKG
jgi:tetratricopeptide (TPR) repeat protein